MSLGWAALGWGAMLVAALLAVLGGGAALLAARGRTPEDRRAQWLEAARRAAYPLFGAVALANAAMLGALLTDDFALRYVAANSSRATPVFFRVLALWSADEGSLLLWNLVLAGFVAAVALRFRRVRAVGAPAPLAPALGVLYGIALFYVVLVLGPTTPFAVLGSPPVDGRGPLPLLQNHPLMAVHPPALYLGFVGAAVPFAFTIGALLTGESSPAWTRVTRRWALVAWSFLAAGLVLGAAWSYSVLGWGGYWAWDPVENAALLPWLTATAYLHTALLEERRGVARAWNAGLVVLTFSLTTMGTFLTRGSILASVHTFARSLVGPLYLGLLAVALLGGLGLVAARGGGAPRRRAPGALPREATFLGNAAVLLAVTAVVLVGTVYPLVAEALHGTKVTVGAPYFDRATVPLVVLLLALMGAGTVLPWRHASGAALVRAAALPAASGALAAVVAALTGERDPAAALAYALAAFVAAASAAAAVRPLRGALAGRRPGDSAAVLLGRAAWRGRRTTGAMVAHLGLAVAALAITASATGGSTTEVALHSGDTARVGGYVLRYDGVDVVTEPQRTVLRTRVAVSRSGTRAAPLHPSLNLYPGGGQPVASPAVRTGAGHDLYASLLGFSPEGDQATFRFAVNPGVAWLWVGGAVVVLGGLVAALPGRRRHGRGGPVEGAESPAVEPAVPAGVA